MGNKILVQVKIKAKQKKVEKINKSNYIVSVNQSPIKGKANEAIINLLANYLNFPKSKIKIIKGLKSKNKIVEIK